jgi:hypothetical protein
MLELVDKMSVPSRDAIEGSLDKILASRAFRNSDRMSRFLRFVVNHALSADQAPLKELLIAKTCSIAATRSTRAPIQSFALRPEDFARN